MKKILLVCVGVLSIFSVDAYALSLMDLVGNYRLVSDNDIICERNMRVYASLGSTSVFVGQYYFVSVDEGPKTYDDDASHSVTNTYTKNNQLIQEGQLLLKGNGRVTRFRTVVTLSGSSLRIHSTNTDAPGLPTNCSYVRVILPEESRR